MPWLSPEDAHRMLAAAAADMAAAERVYREAKIRRDSLIATFHGQSDMPTTAIAASAGITAPLVPRIAKMNFEHLGLDDGEPMPEYREALRRIRRASRITPERRVRAA